ncbi:hypothetical protein F5Y08DRAFT_306781 [Xylaria arbuscula]|nr:hypothetical protein F5Y08DRAFT_306781 [Xylaria arbuscula]
MPPPLLNIPLEILLHITSYLSTPEYGNFRGTCKCIEGSLFLVFAKEFFSKRQFALVEFSIQALLDISKSRFGPYLTHVIISLQHPRRLSDSSTDVPGSVKYNHYYAAYLDHHDFIETGRDVEMLSDAFKHLPNLQTIGMRDFVSASRHRDGTSWTCYGVPTFEAKTHRFLGLPTIFHSGGHSHNHHDYTSHVFLVILRAMANGAASNWNPRLTRMEVLLHTCLLQDISFKIPKHLDAEISLALSKLKTLFLDHLTEAPSHAPRTRIIQRVDPTPVSTPGFFLSRFLVKITALEHLRLNFQDYKAESTIQFLSWLADMDGNRAIYRDVPPDSLELANAKDSLPLEFPATPKFSNLEALDIGMALVEKRVLLALFTRYKATLKSVGLHKTTLASTALVDKRTNLWAQLCNEMAQADLQLNMLSISYPRQYLGNYNNPPIKSEPVMFKGPRHKTTWKGSAFAQSIKDVVSEMALLYSIIPSSF